MGDFNAHWDGEGATHKDLATWADECCLINQIEILAKANEVTIETYIRGENPSQIDHILTSDEGEVSMTGLGCATGAVEQVGAGRDAETVQHFSLATKVVMADVDVSGTGVGQQLLTQVDGQYYAWVLLEYPMAEANRKFLDDLKARRNTYERFRATQLYDEMNKEIEAYRQFKAKQTPR